MRLKLLTKMMAVAAVATPLMTAAAEAYELVIPGLMYRTGAYAPNGIPFANGFSDYLHMLNERDGGIEGVKIKYVECETGTKQTLVLSAMKTPKANSHPVHWPTSHFQRASPIS